MRSSSESVAVNAINPMIHRRYNQPDLLFSSTFQEERMITENKRGNMMSFLNINTLLYGKTKIGLIL